MTPVITSIDHFSIYDIVEDVIYFFNSNHNDCLDELVEHVLFAHKPLSAMVDESMTEEDEFKYSLPQIFVDILVGHILRLPTPEHKPAYYHLMVMTLCRKLPKHIPPALGRVFFTLFDRMDTLDVECRCRFVTWFSQHLSNFDFRWNWSEWCASCPHDL